MGEAFPVETRMTTGYGGMQLAIDFSLSCNRFQWGNRQRRMYSLNLKIHLQHNEMILLDFLQAILRFKQL